MQNYQLLHQWMSMNKVQYAMLEEFLNSYKDGAYVGRDIRGRITVSSFSSTFDCNIVAWNDEIPKELEPARPHLQVEHTPFTMPNFVLWRNGYNHQIVGYVDNRGKLLGWNTRELKEYVISNNSYKRMSERGEFAFISLDIFNQAIFGHARKFDLKLNRVVVLPEAIPTLLKPKPRGHGRKPKSIEELKSEYKEIIRPDVLDAIAPSVKNPSVIRPVVTSEDPKISQGWLVGAFGLKFDEAVRLISYCFKKKMILKTDITDEFVEKWKKDKMPMI